MLIGYARVSTGEQNLTAPTDQHQTPTSPLQSGSRPQMTAPAQDLHERTSRLGSQTFRRRSCERVAAHAARREASASIQRPAVALAELLAADAIPGSRTEERDKPLASRGLGS
jgi:hypothetical protein